MRRPLLLFYILVGYVLLQFSWWAYLLIELNDNAYRNRIELLETKHQDNKLREKEQAKYEKELHKSWQMVSGEGSVFLALLLIGIYITNRAFRKEDELRRQQHNFLLSITHEFKSPLAAVKLNLQTIQKRQLSTEQHSEMLSKAVMETERIESLVEKSLMATSFEDKSYELEFSTLNFSDLVYRVVSDHIDLRNPVHDIIHHIASSIHIKGDSLSLTTLLSNLIENAEKYSPPGSIIEVRLESTNENAILNVKDQGNGIPHKEQQKIFEKFYRIGNEDTRKTKGTGLGLYIVKHVMELHKGKIRIRSNQPAGSVFEMTFPLAAS